MTSQLGRLVELVNRLQAACALAGDNSVEGQQSDLPGLWEALPQIVAIGGQSAGKSSVLEAVVGRDFLPRGSGICTRRPLVLQLLQAPKEARETATFLHQKGKVHDITESAEVLREEIEKETDRSLGPGKAVSAEPIMLTIRSPKVPNLTVRWSERTSLRRTDTSSPFQLVDMPGITKIATDNQPQSIVRELEDMSRAYIRPKNVIILAVSPANADIATSDAMRLVREFDPQGERTIGVLTKLDLMDKGTDAREVLEGRSLFLRHGWVGVVNRSQADINSRADIKAARDKERAFFKSRADYAHLATGTDVMVTQLSKQLEKAIRRAVPEIQAFIASSCRQLEAELRASGGDVPTDRGGRLHAVLTLLDAFDRAFEALLEGGRGGGERVRAVFETALPASFKALPFNNVFSLRAVKDVIETADGIQPHLLAPELGMRRLIRDGVALLRAPASNVVDSVHAILCDAVEAALADVCKSHPELQRFTALRSALGSTANASLEKHREEARKTVTTLVDMESSYFTASFFRDAQAQAAAQQLAGELGGTPAPAEDGPPAAAGVKNLLSRRPAEPEFSPEIEAHLRRVSGTVSAYVASVVASLKASVPKAVVHVQVLQAKKTLLSPLYQEVGGVSDEQLQQLLGEDQAAVERRASVAQRLALLRKAREEINLAMA
jgi:GTPase SAR1 family protein